MITNNTSILVRINLFNAINKVIIWNTALERTYGFWTMFPMIRNIRMREFDIATNEMNCAIDCYLAVK